MHGNEIKEQQELSERDKEVMKQEIGNKTRESRYNEKYKCIRVEGIPKHLERKGERDSQKLIVRVRCGNTEDWDKYWGEEEERMCTLCERGRGHVTTDVADIFERTYCAKENIERIISIHSLLTNRIKNNVQC